MNSHDTSDLDRLLTIGQVMTHVPLSQSTIERGVQAGTFPAPIHLGRRRVWSARALAEFIANAAASKASA